MLAPYGLTLAAVRQSLERVLANRLEHAEAWLVLVIGTSLLAQQALVDQRFDSRQRVQAQRRLGVADLRDS